jgi:cysteinyl-tRNA synthetase
MTLHVLLKQHAPELIRFLVLSTHYRSPIEWSDAELAAKRKALDSFHRLFERVQRITGASPYDGVPPLAYDASSPTCVVETSPHDEGALRGVCGETTQRFVAAMDDDFNTGNAIAALFEFASAINRHIETAKLESEPQESACADLLGATRRLVGLGRLIGLFLEHPAKSGVDDGLTDAVMQVLIQVRQHVRKNKDFATADMIRDRLKEQGITLEDRPDGTIWRRE